MNINKRKNTILPTNFAKLNLYSWVPFSALSSKYSEIELISQTKPMNIRVKGTMRFIRERGVSIC